MPRVGVLGHRDRELGLPHGCPVPPGLLTPSARGLRPGNSRLRGCPAGRRSSATHRPNSRRPPGPSPPVICWRSSQSAGKPLTCPLHRKNVTSSQTKCPGSWGFLPQSLGHSPSVTGCAHPPRSFLSPSGFVEAPWATRLIQSVAVGDSLSSRVKDVAGSACTASPILKPPGSLRPRPGWRVQVPWAGLPLALASLKLRAFLKLHFY